VLVRSDAFRATRIIQESVMENPKIAVRWHTEVREFIGKDSKLTALKIGNNQTGRQEEMPIDGVFIFIGLDPNTGFLNGSGIRLDPWKFVVTGHDLVHGRRRPAGFEKRNPYLLETSVPGIFAAGDVRDKSTKQVASAAGEGASVALLVRETKTLRIIGFQTDIRTLRSGR
jgi:thioredoxin reductase (NADPH)